MKPRPASPPQFELYPGWLSTTERAPKLGLPFQESERVDVRRVGEILGVSKGTVIRMVHAGLFRHYRIGSGAGWNLRIEYQSILDYCNMLRIHYLISERNLLRKPAKGRLLNQHILPFALADTIGIEEVTRRLSIARVTAIHLIESGDLVGYQIQIAPASPWRIYAPSLERYLATLHAQATVPSFQNVSRRP
jgi:hypothetical protein